MKNIQPGEDNLKREISFTIKEGSILEHTVTRLGGRVNKGDCTFDTSVPEMLRGIASTYSASSSVTAKAA